MIDAHAHLHVRIGCVGKGVHASFGGSEDTWGKKQAAENHIRLESTVSKTFMFLFLPKEGLYPAASFRVTVLYGMGTLVLNGPKQLSPDPGTGTAAAGSILALKATLVAAEADKIKLLQQS